MFQYPPPSQKKGNRFDWEGKSSPLWGKVSEEVGFPMLKDLMFIDEEEFVKRFASSAVKRIGRERLLRNVAVALGNSGDMRALPILERVLKSEVEAKLVKEHAEWAIKRIITLSSQKEAVGGQRKSEDTSGR